MIIGPLLDNTERKVKAMTEHKAHELAVLLHGAELATCRPEDSECSRVSWSDVSRVSDWIDPGANLVILCNTEWSDYSGSTVNRSNHRSLLRDFPECGLIEISSGWNDWALALPGDMAMEDGPGTLWNALVDLADYPVYDEEDLCLLESDMAWEAWDGYLGHDVTNDLRDLLIKEGIVPLDEYGGAGDEWFALTEIGIKEKWYEVNGNQPEPYYPEGAVSIVFPYRDQTTEAVAEWCSNEIMKEWEEYATSLTGCAGQRALSL